MSDDEKTEELKKQWELHDRLEIEKVYTNLLNDASGRKFLYYLMGITGLGKNPFTANALTMSFACGELNVGQRILADVLASNPEGWILMQREANDEYRTREQFIGSVE